MYSILRRWYVRLTAVAIRRLHVKLFNRVKFLVTKLKKNEKKVDEMKFCKNLQKIIEISDPEWAPYWPNYKMLKKLIKELPSRVPSDDHTCHSTSPHDNLVTTVEPIPSCGPSDRATYAGDGHATTIIRDNHHSQKEDMIKSPAEIAFFKFLHAEMKKSDHFFVKAQDEIAIREDRVREGLDIVQRSASVMVENKWAYAAKSLFRLYKDLLLLETFAIMSYCSFSKILKKHDKVTGNATRSAFMAKVVNHSSFTVYPSLLAMIGRCESLYDDVSNKLSAEGKENLCEAEREFISTIFQLKGQYLDTAEKEGADVAERKESQIKRHHLSSMVSYLSSSQLNSINHLTSSLRELVHENEVKTQEDMKSACPSDDNDDSLTKEHEGKLSGKKRSRIQSGVSLVGKSAKP